MSWKKVPHRWLDECNIFDYSFVTLDDVIALSCNCFETTNWQIVIMRLSLNYTCRLNRYALAKVQLQDHYTYVTTSLFNVWLTDCVCYRTARLAEAPMTLWWLFPLTTTRFHPTSGRTQTKHKFRLQSRDPRGLRHQNTPYQHY